MDEKHTQDAKGRVKEAAGALVGDKDLKNEGKVDQVAAKVKDVTDKATEKAKALLHRK